VDHYTSNFPQGLQAGAGVSWIHSAVRGLGHMANGDVFRGMATMPLGGISDVARGILYSQEGYGAPGAKTFIGSEQRKLTPTQGAVRAIGFKTTDMAQTQDIITSEKMIVEQHYKRERKKAVREYVDTMGRRYKNGEKITDDVINKALKPIQQFNKKLMSADSSIRSQVDPIKGNTLRRALKTRITPNKGKVGFETQYTKDLLDEED
jgi:hypothetical protein